MSHVKYSPVGYSYAADMYCLDCISRVLFGRYGHSRVGRGCGCAECRLDRLAVTAGIDRYDEGSFDSDDFPKGIAYHNDLHAECAMDEFSDEPRWLCHDRCARCHEVIDGTSHIGGPDTCPSMPEEEEED